MTFRERLIREYPDAVTWTYLGGCFGCPSTHGYEPEGPCPPEVAGDCGECWDRESPEEGRET